MTKNKKQNKEQKKQKKTMLEKTNEVCLLFPNFKPASTQTKIQKFLKNYFHYKTYLINENFFEKENRNKINK
jgi:hypothetical protein